MNTTKQVNVMIGLLFMAFLVFGAYFATEPAREQAARDTQAELMAKRGAELFVNNCRSCHGMNGMGPDDGGIAPRLNNVAFFVLDAKNPFGLAATPAGEARSIHDFVFNTLACGRSNTAMPLWSERYGGPLSDTQINYLATMMTQGRWDLVKEIGDHHDEPLRERQAEAIAKFQKPYSDPTLKGADVGVKDVSAEQKKAVDAAITNGTAKHYADLTAEQKTAVDAAMAKSILVPDPTTLTVTTKNCGQYGASVLEFRERNPFGAGAGAGGAAGGGGASTDPVTLGKNIATANGCVACHTVDGKASVGPTWKGLAGSDHELADGSKVKADDAYLKESILQPNAKLTKGFAPNLMPQTFGTSLKPEQIDQIIAYIKSLK